MAVTDWLIYFFFSLYLSLLAPKNKCSPKFALFFIFQQYISRLDYPYNNEHCNHSTKHNQWVSSIYRLLCSDFVLKFTITFWVTMLSILLLISGIINEFKFQTRKFIRNTLWIELKNVLRDCPRYFHAAGLLSLQAYKLFNPISFPFEELFCWCNELWCRTYLPAAEMAVKQRLIS